MLRKGTLLLAALLSTGAIGIRSSLADLIYSGTSSSLTRSDNDGSDKRVFVTGLSSGDSKGVFYDLTTKLIYFADGTTIKSVGRSGSNPSTVVSGNTIIYDVVVDQQNDKLIWTDIGAGILRRANLDGSNPETIATAIGAASLAIDAVKGKIYWTELVSGNVRRANLDGSNQQTIATNQGQPSGIVVDVVNERVYWTSATQNTIRRANLDGASAINVVAGLNSPPRGITLFQGNLYWVSDNSSVLRSTVDGGNQTSLGTVTAATDIEFSSDSIDPTPTPTPTSTATGTPNTTVTATPTGTIVATATPTGSPVAGTPTATPLPGTTPTVGTPSTPGPTPTPTPLPNQIVKASELFGFVYSGTSPVENVLVNGGSLGIAATDEDGKFVFSKATPGSTYSFAPERTGLLFSPTSASLTAQIGAPIPFFVVTAISTPATTCRTIDISDGLITIANAMLKVRNKIVSELFRLNKLEQRNARLQKSSAARAQLLADTQSTFLALVANSPNIPEVVFRCTDTTVCPTTSFATALAFDRAQVKSLKRFGSKLKNFITQAGDSARATRVTSAINKDARTASVLLSELPKDTSSCP